MSRRLWIVWLAPILVAALVAAGCGGGDRGEATAEGGSTVANQSVTGDENAAPISKAAFLKKGDAVCAEGREKISAAAGPVLAAKPGEREDLEIKLVGEVLVPAIQTDVDDLRALGAPPGDEEEVNAIIAEIEKVLATAEEEPEAFVVPEDPSVKRPDQWRPADKRAEEYGFKECPRS